MSTTDPYTLPPLVQRAEALATKLAFRNSCRREFGRLLCTLAARVDGSVLEIGTGCGVGSAWILSGLSRGGRLVSIDLDRERHLQVKTHFADIESALFLQGDWRSALEHGPYELAFVDAGEAKDAGADEVIEAVAPGGHLILDDFSPGPLYKGQRDERWHRWMQHPKLVSCEILLDRDSSAILATKVA
ncbi:MAG: class I SAM-dependent methyltransferase [Trueperaceae bacterium]